MNARISIGARQRIVSRPNGATTVITLAQLQDGNELAYAIRVLTDHFTYKRSKSGSGLNEGAAQEAVEAMETALAGFKQEVLGFEGAQPENPPVSPLADGKIGNPWAYVGNGA